MGVTFVFAGRGRFLTQRWLSGIRAWNLAHGIKELYEKKTSNIYNNINMYNNNFLYNIVIINNNYKHI